MDKDKVLVVGANGFVGQHVMKELQEDSADICTLRTYDLERPFRKTLQYTDSVDVSTFSESLGSTAQLREALKGMTAVINCLDEQDLRLLPDTERIRRVNSVFVGELAQAVSAERSVKRVVHLSSLLATASFLAPSVFPTELSASIPRPAFAVFPDYCRAKQEAEAFWAGFEDVSVMILRLPMVYGEGDRDSFIMDVLRYCAAHGGTCHLIKRYHGKIQYSYAGNIGQGVVKSLRKMRSLDLGKKEIINLVDNTPTLNTWDMLSPYVESRGYKVEVHQWPFYSYYIPWRIAEVSAWLLSKAGVQIPDKVRNFPGSGLLYVHFFYWYFWSGVKARLYLDFVPKYDEEESIKRSVAYYKSVDLSPPK